MSFVYHVRHSHRERHDVVLGALQLVDCKAKAESVRICAITQRVGKINKDELTLFNDQVLGWGAYGQVMAA